MKFQLKNKKTFYSPGKVCFDRLNSEFKNPFYCVEKTGGFLFNLPKGSYKLTSGEFTDAEQNLIYSVDLPPFGSVENIPQKVKVRFGKTAVKAKIYRKLDLVIIDKSFKNYPLYVAKFMLEHEKAHYYYNKSSDLYDSVEIEKNCDLMAAKKMLEVGYNPSQIYEAVKILGDGKIANDRIENIRAKVSFDEIDKFFE